MTSRLNCFSFHSVKGGVGKSTLSTFTACALAHEHPESQVYLVDMDLTGTSLADVLPLEAPRWDGVGPDEPLDMSKRPDGFHSRLDSRMRMKVRGSSQRDMTVAVGVPFLNDYLLFAPKTWNEEYDLHPVAMAWRMVDGPSNMRVFPSSALPRDLTRALPVIYDEEHAAFLEARLEHLLSYILKDEQESYIVFDTPPTIPGLSHSILNMAFRLSRSPKTPLAEDGIVPDRLEAAIIDWNVRIVATQDMQDVRAAARWLEWVHESDQHIVRLVINRAWKETQQREAYFYRALREPSDDSENNIGEFEPLGIPNPIVAAPIWIEEYGTMQTIFHEEKTPPRVKKLLNRLTGDDSEDMGLD